MMQLLKRNVVFSFAVFLTIVSVGCAVFGYYGGGILQKNNTAIGDLNWAMKPTADYEHLETTDQPNVFVANCTGKHEKHLIDATGKVLEKWPGENLGHGYFEHFDGEKAGVADKDGNFLIQPDYAYIQADGDYFVAHQDNQRISFWNLEGKCIHEEPQAANAYYLGKNTFLVDQEGIAKSYLFDADSRKTKSLKKHVTFVFDDGKGGLVGDIDGLYYHLDKNFDVAEGTQVYEQYGELSEGLRYVTLYNEKTGNVSPCYINTDEEVVITLDEMPDNASVFSEGKAFVQTGNKLVCINTNGRELFTLKIKQQYSSFRFYDDFCYSEGLAAVSLDNDKYGYIDETGEFVIPPVLDVAWEFENGYAIAAIEGEEYQFGILKMNEGGRDDVK